MWKKEKKKNQKYTHTLKKFKKESSGTSEAGVADDVGGSRGPSITDKLGTASSSSNSLPQAK